MNIFNNKLLILLVSIFTITSCSSDDDATSSSVVSFSPSTIEISTDDLSAGTVNLSISPASPTDSDITIIAPGNNYGVIFTTQPELLNGQIVVPVTGGVSSVSFQINIIEAGLGFNDFEQEFEIIAVGNGLRTNDFEGRFLSFNVTNNFEPDGDLPFSEDFSICGVNGSGELPPENWQVIDVEQNSFGTGGFSCYTGQGVVGVGTNPFTPDGEATSGDDYSESWLISPSISLVGSDSPNLSFDFDRRFDAPIDDNTLAYDLLISTDYNGSNLATANWTVFQAGVDAMTANDPGFDGIENTGPLSLSQYIGQEITIAVVYRSKDAYFEATAIRLANIQLQ